MYLFIKQDINNDTVSQTNNATYEYLCNPLRLQVQTNTISTYKPHTTILLPITITSKSVNVLITDKISIWILIDFEILHTY